MRYLLAPMVHRLGLCTAVFIILFQLPLAATLAQQPRQSKQGQASLSAPKRSASRVSAAAAHTVQPPPTDSTRRPKVATASYPMVDQEEPWMPADEQMMPVSSDQACQCSRHAARPCACQGNDSRSHWTGLWVRAEYLGWSLDDIDLPPLVTTSSGTTPANTGILNGGTTTVLFGDQTTQGDMQSGGRITLGWWANPSHDVGYEVSYLRIESSGDDFSASSSQFPRLARPIFDTAINAESARLVAHPDFLTGSISVAAEANLQAIDAMRKQSIASSSCQRTDFLIGYRHASLDELLRVDQESLYTAAQGQILAGTTTRLFDRFETDNQFDGIQLGLSWQRHHGAFTLSSLAKVGLGMNRMEATVAGETVNTVPGGGAATIAGGLLAQSTNIGAYDDTNFIAIPEFGANLSLQLTPRTQLLIGYSAMYWSKVARAADQIDRSVSQFPPELPTGQQRPEFRFATDEFFVHGLNAGLTYRF